MNNAKETKRNDISGGVVDNDKRKDMILKSSLIGGGILLVLLIIYYVFSGGSSNEIKKDTVPKDKPAVTSTHKPPTQQEEKKALTESKPDKIKEEPKEQAIIAKDAKVKNIKIVRAAWLPYLGGNFIQAFVVFLTIPCFFSFLYALAYEVHYSKILSLFTGGGQKEAWTNVFYGILYTLALTNYEGKRGMYADNNIANWQSLIGVPLCVSVIFWIVLMLIDVIAYFAGYDGYSVSALYNWFLTWLPGWFPWSKGIRYYGAEKWYNMIYIEQVSTKS